MKILVIDDSKKHRAEAERLRATHEVTILSGYVEAIRLLKTESGFDVVLADLLMPAEAQTLGQKGLQYLGHEIPIGFALLFVAASTNVKHVAIATDTNHHDHPISAAVDWIGQPYKVDNTWVQIMHAPMRNDPELGWVKDWEEILSRITE